MDGRSITALSALSLGKISALLRHQNLSLVRKLLCNEPLGWVLLFNSIMAGVLISLHFGKNALPS